MHQVSRIEVRRILTPAPPAPAPDDSPTNVPADTTPAGPPAAQSPNNEREHSVSVEPVQENRAHDTMEPKPKPRPLYQQLLKSSSEPALTTSNPECELPREQLAAELARLRAPPKASCHPSVLGQDEVLTRSSLDSGMYDGQAMSLAGRSPDGDTVHTPGNGGNPCDCRLNYRRHERRSRSSTRARVHTTRVDAPAPVAPGRGVVGNSQRNRVSFEDMEATIEHRHEDMEITIEHRHRDTGVVSEIAKAPILRSPHDSGGSHRVPQRSTRWDQNIKKNCCTRWLWLILPDLCLLVSAFIAAVCLEKFLDNFRWMHRRFPMTWDSRTSTWVGPVDISWPKQDFIVPILTAEILIPLIPTIILLAMQIWVRNFWDFNTAVFGLFKGIAIVYVAFHPISRLNGKNKLLLTLLQVILKSFIGKFRPHFMSVCDPHGKMFEIAELASSPAIRFASVSECPALRFRRDPQGFYGPLFPTTPVRTIGKTAEYKALRFAMQSFPSGHTMEAFCVGVYLSLYLNAKLKACSDYHTSFWKLVVVLSPIVGAAFIAASVAVDHNHHFQDVVLSIPIGVLVGLLAYRTHYMSIFNYHTNHLYLPWSSMHRSTNLTAPTVPMAQDAKHGYRFKSKYRHNTAVAWPRRPETQGWDRGQETGTVGLDGSGDGRPRQPRRSRVPRTLKKGIMRQSMFPVRGARSTDAVRSRDNISPMTEGPPLMSPASMVAEYSTPPGPPSSAATSHGFDPPERDVTPIMTPVSEAAEHSTPRGPPNSAATSSCFDPPKRDLTRVMTPTTRGFEYWTPRAPPDSAATSPYFDSPGSVAPATTPNSRSPERVAVDDWLYGGRPSDMV